MQLAAEQEWVEPAPQARSGCTLWQRYHLQRCALLRDQLIERYMRFARIMAAKTYAGRAFEGVEFEDYLQYAHVGLIESIDRFDPERGVKFETFCAPRITGAILNGLESASDIHGQVAARRRLIAARVESMREEGVAPESAKDVFAALADVAIGLAIGFALDDSGMYCSEESDYPDPGYAAVEMKQLRQRALSLLALLPGNQRLVIQYHYLQQIAFEQIAKMLELSAGRIAQIHREALARLRAGFKETGALRLSC